MSRATKITVRILCIAGVVGVGAPLALPLVLATAALATGQGFLVDFLLPGELFPVVAVGGALLSVAALMMHRMTVGISGLTIGTVGSFILTGWLAEAVWLAEGRARAVGWQLIVVGGAYALYLTSAVMLLAAGAVLCRRAFVPPVAAIRPEHLPEGVVRAERSTSGREAMSE